MPSALELEFEKFIRQNRMTYFFINFVIVSYDDQWKFKFGFNKYIGRGSFKPESQCLSIAPSIQF